MGSSILTAENSTATMIGHAFHVLGAISNLIKEGAAVVDLARLLRILEQQGQQQWPHNGNAFCA